MESFGIINYLTYVLGAVLIILLPGPNSIYVLSLAAQQGTRSGWAAVAGVFVGDSLLMIATALGAISILTAYPAVFMVVKYAGAAYLIYIGITLIGGAISTWKTLDDNGLDDKISLKKTTGTKAFNKALLVSILNPKAILFFLSFFVQFVDPNYPSPAVPFFILALTLQFFSLVYLAVLIYAGSTLAAAFKKRKKVTAISGGGVGSLFVFFAVKLAFASV
ncbi:MAG: leucine efflux protein LeuE [Gammaproteobacteria bacterium]|nr:leucine efflux protein LeuE [Gammaproteobacteria bacterium]